MKKNKTAGTAGELERLLLPMASLEIPMLTSVEVTEILQIKAPRLERFQDNYPALKAGQPGKGRGTRRLFSANDVLRIAVAKWLLDDRFQPCFVGEILEDLQHLRLFDFDENGQQLDLLLMLERDASGRRTPDFVYSKSGQVPSGRKTYYTLDLFPLFQDVNQRINDVLVKRGQKKQTKRPDRKKRTANS